VLQEHSQKHLISQKKTSAEKAQLRFAIDSDKRIRFKWISDVMEALRRTRQTQFNFVTDKQQ